MSIETKVKKGCIGIMAGKAIIELVYSLATGSDIREIMPSDKIFSQDLVYGMYEGATLTGPALCAGVLELSDYVHKQIQKRNDQSYKLGDVVSP